MTAKVKPPPCAERGRWAVVPDTSRPGLHSVLVGWMTNSSRPVPRFGTEVGSVKLPWRNGRTPSWCAGSEVQAALCELAATGRLVSGRWGAAKRVSRVIREPDAEFVAAMRKILDKRALEAL